MDLPYEGAMLRYLKSWTLQLRWQPLPAFEKLAHLLIDHVDGILNYCRIKVRFGVVEAINGNIKSILRRGRGTKIYATCSSRLSAWRSPRPNSSSSEKPHEMGLPSNSCSEPLFCAILTIPLT